MRTHITVGSLNLTPYIVDGTYKVNTEASYESWNDGNMNEHRVVIATKVVGTFDIVCVSDATQFPDKLLLDDFLTAWNSVTNNDVVSLGVYVPSLNQFMALSCYAERTSKDHIVTANGSTIDTFTISIKER